MSSACCNARWVKGADECAGRAAALDLVVVGVLGEGLERFDCGAGRVGKLVVGAVARAAAGVAEVGLDVGMGEVVEELAEEHVYCARDVNEGGAGGEIGGDDVGLRWRQGWEIGEVDLHEGQGRGEA